MTPTFYLCTTITLLELWARLHWCMTGPGINTPGQPTACVALDVDQDGDVDLKDVAKLWNGEA